ncbi:Centrosomal protein POC5 [Plasmodiophora brassicae]|uniref:Centrosomal protein POC5 n=1 Tax=Plasmodiophora brassicae TaxID=37360 RepID=A0A0G4IVE3_PLABS|nr:hypothetical protein PBRA_001208 [Plasmodiophora brassicae]
MADGDAYERLLATVSIVDKPDDAGEDVDEGADERAVNPGEDVDPAGTSVVIGELVDDDGFKVIDDAVLRLRTAMQDHCISYREDIRRRYEASLERAQAEHSVAMTRAQDQLEQVKERLAVLADQHEKVVASEAQHARLLGRVVGNYAGACAMRRAFSTWKRVASRHAELERSVGKWVVPANKLKRKLRAFSAWNAALRAVSKQQREVRVQGAPNRPPVVPTPISQDLFKSQLEAMSRTLVSTYEATLQTMRAKLDEAERQIALHVQNKARVEREMKQAFLRSVSALNLEAMSMLNTRMGDPADAQIEPRSSVPTPATKGAP